MFGYQIYLKIILFGHFTAPLFTPQRQATTPSIYLHTHAVLALAVGFQTFSPSPTYIPVMGTEGLQNGRGRLPLQKGRGGCVIAMLMSEASLKKNSVSGGVAGCLKKGGLGTFFFAFLHIFFPPFLHFFFSPKMYNIFLPNKKKRKRKKKLRPPDWP